MDKTEDGALKGRKLETSEAAKGHWGSGPSKKMDVYRQRRTVQRPTIAVHAMLGFSGHTLVSHGNEILWCIYAPYG